MPQSYQREVPDERGRFGVSRTVYTEKGPMKLNVKAAAVSVALFWGAVMFLMALANLKWPSYGQAFLDLIASVYPGYKATASFGQVVVGTLYAVVDGAVCGLVFAWLYNLFVGAASKPA